MGPGYEDGKINHVGLLKLRVRCGNKLWDRLGHMSCMSERNVYGTRYEGMIKQGCQVPPFAGLTK